METFNYIEKPLTIRNRWNEYKNAAAKKATEPRVSQEKIRVITAEVCRSPSWFVRPVGNIHITNDNGYLPTSVKTNSFLYRLWLISIVVIQWLCLLSYTTGATSVVWFAYPSRAPRLILVFVGFVLLQL